MVYFIREILCHHQHIVGSRRSLIGPLFYRRHYVTNHINHSSFKREYHISLIRQRFFYQYSSKDILKNVKCFTYGPLYNKIMYILMLNVSLVIKMYRLVCKENFSDQDAWQRNYWLSFYQVYAFRQISLQIFLASNGRS